MVKPRYRSFICLLKKHPTPSGGFKNINNNGVIPTKHEAIMAKTESRRKILTPALKIRYKVLNLHKSQAFIKNIGHTDLNKYTRGINQKLSINPSPINYKLETKLIAIGGKYRQPILGLKSKGINGKPADGFRLMQLYKKVIPRKVKMSYYRKMYTQKHFNKPTSKSLKIALTKKRYYLSISVMPAVAEPTIVNEEKKLKRIAAPTHFKKRIMGRTLSFKLSIHVAC